MSHRLEMIQTARLAPRLLGDSTRLVVRFIESQWHPGGGFKNRNGQPDLYYTVFGLNSAIALETSAPASAAQFLSEFGSGENLDLVHLACLARCWASLQTMAGVENRRANTGLIQKILARIENHRAADGGYALSGKTSTAYGTFLAGGAYEDWNIWVPKPIKALRFLTQLKLAGGGWSHDKSSLQASTTVTAAAVSMLTRLHTRPDPASIQFLLSMLHPMGGFLAAPMAPGPDLLSTATALDALRAAGVDFARFRNSCIDYIDTLWSNEGGFFSHWMDDALDVEYVFYGLLALGQLCR